MSIEAMKQALEALEYIHQGANNQGPHTGISWRCASNKAEPAITALRQAIEQAEKQEPCQYAIDVAMSEHRCVGKCQYASQREWVGLTDEEIKEGYNTLPIKAPMSWSTYQNGARMTEAKLKEKNT